MDELEFIAALEDVMDELDAALEDVMDELELIAALEDALLVPIIVEVFFFNALSRT